MRVASVKHIFPPLAARGPKQSVPYRLPALPVWRAQLLLTALLQAGTIQHPLGGTRTYSLGTGRTPCRGAAGAAPAPRSSASPRTTTVMMMLLSCDLIVSFTLMYCDALFHQLKAGMSCLFLLLEDSGAIACFQTMKVVLARLSRRLVEIAKSTKPSGCLLKCFQTTPPCPRTVLQISLFSTMNRNSYSNVFFKCFLSSSSSGGPVNTHLYAWHGMIWSSRVD